MVVGLVVFALPHGLLLPFTLPLVLLVPFTLPLMLLVLFFCLYLQLRKRE